MIMVMIDDGVGVGDGFLVTKYLVTMIFFSFVLCDGKRLC